MRPPGHPRAAVAALAAVLAGCALDEPPGSARLVSAAPAGAVAPDAVRVELAFSAPLDPRGVADGLRFALCRLEDQRAVTLAADAEAGLGPDAPVVPARRSLEAGGTRAVLVPEAPLAAEASWVAVLSRRARAASGGAVLDADGRARAIAVPFDTGPAPDRTPPAARWIRPPHGPVPRDVSALRVGFDEPVTGALALAGGAPGRPLALGPELLGLELLAALAPGALALVTAGVRDAAGNAAAPPPPLEVSRCPAAGAPALAAAPGPVAAELAVRLDAALLGMGRLVAELSARPGEPACGAAPVAPATAALEGEAAPCAGWDPCRPAAVSCPAALAVAPLCPGQPVRVRIATEDLAGHRGAPGAWLEVAALPPRAAPALSEALADADAPEAGGEYAEVVNVGTGDADLAGYALAKRTAGGALQRCTLATASGGPVPPGGYALVVGGAYDGRYALPPEVAVYRCGATALDGGLANDRPVALALEDAAGRTVSTLGMAEPAPRCAPGALERVAPAGPDAAANLACPGTRTPGACNASTPPERCATRGW